MTKWERGALDAEVIERPLISLNVTFNGTIYKDVKFAIREGGRTVGSGVVSEVTE